MVLDDVLVRLQGVDLGTKSQAGNGVHGVAHQVRLQVNRLALGGGPLPALAQPIGHALQSWKVMLDMRRVKAGHHHAALAAPGVVVGAEHPRRQAHLGPDLVQALGAAKGVRPVTQNGGHLGVVRHHHDLARAQLQAKQGTVLQRPLLALQMQARRLHLKQVAKQRYAAWSGQVLVASHARYCKGKAPGTLCQRSQYSSAVA